MALNANISNTFTFDPTLGEAIIAAYARVGIRRTEITQQHMADANAEANYTLSDWQGDGLNTWQVELVTETIFAGVGQYNVPNTTVFTLDLYIRQNPDSGMPIDRLLVPISRSDYAAIANKNMQGFPTSYWYDRQLNPVLYLWPVPNQEIVGGLRYYVQKRPMDELTNNGTQIAIPYEAYDAFVWCLAERLCYIYAPEKAAIIAPRAQKAYQRMLQSTTENVPIDFNVMVGSYFRVG